MATASVPDAGAHVGDWCIIARDPPRRGVNGRCPMLRFAEEVMLLLLDEEDGQMVSTDRPALHVALAGGVLMDLALEARIDTDLDHLILLDATPTGDELLDPTLASIAAAEEHPPRYWVDRIAAHADAIRDAALARLIRRGYLHRRRGRFGRGPRARPQTTVDGVAVRDVKTRVTNVLFGARLPDPREIAAICLCDVCGLFDTLLVPADRERLLPRIRQLGRMDLIAQAVLSLVGPAPAGASGRIRPLLSHGLAASG